MRSGSRLLGRLGIVLLAVALSISVRPSVQDVAAQAVGQQVAVSEVPTVGTAAATQGVYSGTMTTTVTLTNYFGTPIREETRQYTAYARVASPLRSQSGFLTETNPFNLVITRHASGSSGNPANLAELEVHSAFSVEPALFQYWTYQITGNTFSGTLTNAHNAEAAALNLVNSLEAFPGSFSNPCAGVMEDSRLAGRNESAATMSGTFNGNNLKIRISGYLTACGQGSQPFESTIDTNLNGVPNPAPQLTVIRAGTGTGTVTSSPTGITCGTDCSQSYTSGTRVTLTATTTGGSTFGGWSGSCTGTATTCTVTVDANKTATATFAPPPILTVTTGGTGTGSVTSAPAGISCGATCSASFASGARVTLTAGAGTASAFAGWSGACTGTATTCTVTMSAARSVVATFALLPVTCTPRPRVSVTTRPRGAGQLTATIAVSGQNNLLTQVTLGDPRQRPAALTNALLDLPDGRTNVRDSVSFTLPPFGTSTSFVVRREVAGRPTQVPVRVVDRCGEWRTFIGGGAGGF